MDRTMNGRAVRIKKTGETGRWQKPLRVPYGLSPKDAEDIGVVVLDQMRTERGARVAWVYAFPEEVLVTDQPPAQKVGVRELKDLLR